MHQVKVKSQHCGNWFLTTTTSRYGLVLRTWRFSPKCLNVHVHHHHHHLIFCFGLSHAGHAVLIGHSYAVLIGDPWSHTWVVDFCHITTRACLTGFHTRWVTIWQTMIVTIWHCHSDNDDDDEEEEMRTYNDQMIWGGLCGFHHGWVTVSTRQRQT